MDELKRISFEPTWGLIKRPVDYPTEPSSGKIQLIFENNSRNLYHRLSPYTNYGNGLFTWGSQPFFFTYPDEGKKGLPSLRKYESRIFPIGSAPIDVIRVSKFLTSGVGVKFLASQFLLQTNNAYNETRIYNPTSPIVAAGMGLTLGLVRPQRNFDTSGGLFGLATTLIGPSIPSLFKEPTVNPPAGTTGLAALADSMKSTGGKGLLRAGTANRGRSHLEAAWIQSGKGNGITKSFKSIVKGIFTSVFRNFIPQRQDGIIYRSDEGAYGLMLANGPSGRFKYLSSVGREIEYGPAWFAGGTIMRKNGQIPNSYKMFVKYDINGIRTEEIVYAQEGYSTNLLGIGNVGYTPQISTNENKAGMRYGDNVGTNISNREGEYYTNSDILRQYANYVDPNQKFPTKRTSAEQIANRKDELLKVISNLSLVGSTKGIGPGGVPGGIYAVDVPDDSQVFNSGITSKGGYDRLFEDKISSVNNQNPIKSFIGEYRNSGITMVSNELSNNSSQTSYKLPTAGWFDAINTLEVLDKNRTINDSKLINWNVWEPYKDDVVAFYFYDIVNSKYIPFRAAIKNMSESGTAKWSELSFIGRADTVYSYGGFSRNLNLSIKIVINSIIELAPTWQRINYMTSLIKPANYTTHQINGEFNRFIIPPMIMLTIGDMYKDQPIILQSITTTIPDDAAWETNSEINKSEWEYLVNYIKSPNVKFGQLPREVDLSFSMHLLEKERAVAGGANFGHAPRNNEWDKEVSTTPFHENLVVDVINK